MHVYCGREASPLYVFTIWWMYTGGELYSNDVLYWFFRTLFWLPLLRVKIVGLLPCMFSLLSESVQGVSLTPMIAYIDFLEYYIYHILLRYYKCI